MLTGPTARVADQGIREHRCASEQGMLVLQHPEISTVYFVKKPKGLGFRDPCIPRACPTKSLRGILTLLTEPSFKSVRIPMLRTYPLNPKALKSSTLSTEVLLLMVSSTLHVNNFRRGPRKHIMQADQRHENMWNALCSELPHHNPCA